MKSIILASVAIVIGLAAFTASAVATHGHHHERGSVGNTVCIHCGGTGRSYGPNGKGTGNFKCNICKGTGWNGSY